MKRRKPQIKVYDRHGQCQGTVHDLDLAEAAMRHYGSGATVRLGHYVIWEEDGRSTSESGWVRDAIIKALHDQARERAEAANARWRKQECAMDAARV